MKKLFNMIFPHKNKVDLEAAERQVKEVNDKLVADEERRHTVVSYLEARKDRNGFGSDFEYTLRPKRG